MHMRVLKRLLFWLGGLSLAAGLVGCGSNGTSEQRQPVGISPQVMADALHAVMEADRTVYARHVAHRLQKEDGVIQVSEHWQEDKALPLPSQMFRMGAELVAKETDLFTYSLLSKWPINKRNAPKTEVEETGLEAVAGNPAEPFYGTESLGGVSYFTAVYADVAVSPACVACHNAHKDSPRDDFELGETMGGVVIRIPLAG